MDESDHPAAERPHRETGGAGEQTDRTGLASAARRFAAGPLARSAALSLGIRVLGMVLGFAQAVLLARMLNPAGYGLIAFAISTANVLAVVAVSGFGTFAVREIPRLRARGQSGLVGHFVHFATRAVLLVSILCAVPLLLFTTLWPATAGHYAPGVAVAALATVPFALVLLFRGIAQGDGRVAAAQLPGEVGRPAIVCAALGVAYFAGVVFNTTQALYVVLAASACAAVIGLSVVRGSFARAARESTGGTVRADWMRGGLSFFGTSVLYALQAELATILLATLAGPAQAGLFQPVLQVSPLVMLPITAAQVRFAPRIAELWEAGRTGQVAALTTLFARSTTIIAAVIALAIVSAGPILFSLFGPNFRASTDLLWIIAAAQVFNAACGPCGMLLAMTGHNKVALRGLCATIAAMTLAGIPLVSTFGALGAALSVALGLVVFNLILCVATHRLLGISTTVLGSGRALNRQS